MVSNYVNFTVKCAKRSKDLRNETLNKSSRVQQRFGISPEVWCHHVYLKSHRQHPMAKLRCIVSPLFAAVDLRHFTHLEALYLPNIDITKNRWKHQSIIWSPFVRWLFQNCPKRDKLSSQNQEKEEQRFQVIQLHWKLNMARPCTQDVGWRIVAPPRGRNFPWNVNIWGWEEVWCGLVENALGGRCGLGGQEGIAPSLLKGLLAMAYNRLGLFVGQANEFRTASNKLYCILVMEALVHQFKSNGFMYNSTSDCFVREIPRSPTTPFRTRPCTSRPRNPMKASRESSMFGWKQGNNNHRPKNHLSITYPPSCQLPFNEWPKERINIALQDFSGFVGCSTRQILKAASFKMRGKRWWEILKKWKPPIDIWKKSLSLSLCDLNIACVLYILYFLNIPGPKQPQSRCHLRQHTQGTFSSRIHLQQLGAWFQETSLDWNDRVFQG